MRFIYALTAEAETTFWEDVWNYLYDVYLRVDGNYQNLGFEKTPLFSLRLTVLGIFVGGIFACLAMAYHKQVLGGAVCRLLEKDCKDADSAMTAQELGYGKNILVKYALCRSVALRRVVKCAEAESFYGEQAEDKAAYDKKIAQGVKLPRYKEREYLVDIGKDRFFIPEELRESAQGKFRRRGSGWVTTLISIVVLVIIFFIILLVLPQLLGFVDGIIPVE